MPRAAYDALGRHTDESASAAGICEIASLREKGI
jgi:hypothetical protein